MILILIEIRNKNIDFDFGFNRNKNIDFDFDIWYSNQYKYFLKVYVYLIKCTKHELKISYIVLV